MVSEDTSQWEDLGIAQPDLSAYVSNSVVTAKGDLIVATGNAAVDNLAAGTNGYVLTADSGETLGLKWAPAASGGADIDPLFLAGV